MCEKEYFVFVRSEDGKDTLSLRLNLRGRECRFLRAKNEPVGRALKRIATNLARNGETKRKKKGKGGDGVDDTLPAEVVLYAGITEVSSETENQDAWVGGNTLRVDDRRFVVTVNTPAVKFLKLPCCLLATCPAVPLVELEFADVEHCRWAWRRYDPANPLPPTVFPESAATDKDRPVVDPKPRLPISDPIISTSFIYWTAEEDEGYKLVLECTPCNESGEEGEPVKVVSKNIVSRFWNIPMMERHLMTPNHLAEPTQFRVVSYNILADVYATSERARSALYPYCDPSALDQDYRRCLIARELLGYHGDIVCLQEVGAKCFSQFLCPALHQWGYQACFHPKAGKTPEGEATFFNSSKFSLIQEDAVVLREFVNQSPNCRDILSLHPLILADLLERHNILQTVLLRSTEITNSYILAANTHLYFHPMGDHIRLLQVAISLKILGSKLREYQHKLGTDARFAVVFCGDFNSCPCTAAYSYL
ncbi:2',5'-phosphodiesterase 12, partial [Geodia barretti]